MANTSKVKDLLGKENYDSIIFEAKDGSFTEQKLTELARLLGSPESGPNIVYGYHQRRMESNRNRESYSSEVQSILSDWWNQQGYKMDQCEAVRLLRKTLKEIDLKPLASNLVTSEESTMIVIDEQPTGTTPRSRSRKASRSRSSGRSKSRSTSRWRHAIGRSCYSVISRFCHLCVMTLVRSCGATFIIGTEKFQKLPRARKLILLSVVFVVFLYIYHCCGLGHSIAPSGTRSFLNWCALYFKHRSATDNKLWVGWCISR